MTEGTKIAAAILAVEASRQDRALKERIEAGRNGAPQGYNIAGGILDHYRHFLDAIAE